MKLFTAAEAAIKPITFMKTPFELISEAYPIVDNRWRLEQKHLENIKTEFPKLVESAKIRTEQIERLREEMLKWIQLNDPETCLNDDQE